MKTLPIYIQMLLPQSEDDLRSRMPPGTQAVFSRDIPADERKHRFLEAKVAYGMISVAWLRESTQLDWLQLETAGIDGYAGLAEESWAQRIRVTNVKGFFAVPVAETLVAGVLALYRGLDQLIGLQSARTWKKEEIRAALRTLNGARVLVLGAGSIALHVGKLLKGFDCSVMYYARSSPVADARTTAELEGLLPTVDLVVGCLPDSPSTRDLLDRRRLALMKPSAMLANGGRGSLIDEDALLEMLQSGRLAGAVLDVTRKEPLDADAPLWNCPNLILTQHTSGGFENEVPGKNDFFLANLERYRRAQPLLSPVDLSKDY